MKLRILSLMVAAALLPMVALGNDAPKADPAKQAELEQARAELERSARRVAELSRELGGTERTMVIERTMQEMRRPGVGIVMSPLPEGQGVKLAAVTPEGPAAKAGLQAGDVLRSVDGKAITAGEDAGVEQARKLLANLEMGQKLKLGYERDGRKADATVTVDSIRRTMVFTSGDTPGVHAFSFSTDPNFPGMDPEVRVEIDRIRSAPCPPGSEDCNFPVLAQAFRWNGLNLASMDAKLGRYFGTDTGVLVLSGGPGLTQVEPGDVIQRIDGKPVATPRDAMRALGAQDTGTKVKVELLRERKPRTVEVTVPEATPMRWFAPPAPPAPPAPRAPAPPTPATEL